MLNTTAKRAIIGTIAMLGICAYFVPAHLQEKHWLSLVPSGLGVTKILYEKGDSWGFGPGGNETGVVAFALPTHVSEKIQSRGIHHLNDLPPEMDANGRSRSFSWQATPALLEGSDDNTNRILSSDVSNYLNRYGFGIEIDSTIKRQINDALSNAGSYLSHQRNGLLIVAPELQRVFYVYSG